MENNTSEINLVNSFKILIKNKIIILCCFLLGILFACGIIFLAPKIYIAQALVEIGRIDNSPRGVVFTHNVNQSIDEKISLFRQKYPSLSLVSVSEGVIQIKDYSPDKTEAERNVLDIVSLILLEDNNIKINIESDIEQLKKSRDDLMRYGQQVASLELEIFARQKDLRNLKPPRMIENPSVAIQEKLPPIFILLIGGLLGIFISVMAIGAKEWWNKNKKLF